MPIIQLDFNNPLNVSVQVGDTAYYCNTFDVGPNWQWASTTTPHRTAGQSNIIEIGVITLVYQFDGSMSYIQCNMPQLLFNQYFAGLSVDSFIMFSKDNKVNLNSMLGYYASVTFRNNSSDKAELFSVGTEIFESSK